MTKTRNLSFEISDLNSENCNVETELKTELNSSSDAEHVLLMKKKKLRIDFNFFSDTEYFFSVSDTFSAISEFKLLSDRSVEEIINQISVNEFINASDIVSNLSVSDKSEEIINQLSVSNKFIDASEISSAESNFKLFFVSDQLSERLLDFLFL